MPILNQTVTVECDCGEMLEVTAQEFVTYPPTIGPDEDELATAGWTFDDMAFYCPRCSEKEVAIDE
jgi:hypothetical protein